MPDESTTSTLSSPPSRSWRGITYVLAFLVLVVGYFVQTQWFQPNRSSSQLAQHISHFGQIKLLALRSQERGHSDHGWLKTFHTFPFADYSHTKLQSFGPLRVLNEDRVEPHQGFGTHPHSEFEIFSYVVSGELEHKDSMGNTEILKRGDVQLTSAGTGIRHSEGCYGDKPVHFLQIWTFPSVRGLPPTYYTRHFTDEEKHNKLLKVVAPVDTPGVLLGRDDLGPAPVHSPVTLYASILSPNATVAHTFPRSDPSNPSKAFIHLIQSSGYQPGVVSVGGVIAVNNETLLREGDGVFAWAESEAVMMTIQNVGTNVVEVLVFDAY